MPSRGPPPGGPSKPDWVNGICNDPHSLGYPLPYVNSPVLNTYTGEGGTCLQGLPRFLTFHTSTFLPLAEGLKATLQLGLTSCSKVTPNHRLDRHGSVLHLSTCFSFSGTRMGLRSSWLRVNQYLLLTLQKGGDPVCQSQPCLAEVRRR